MKALRLASTASAAPTNQPAPPVVLASIEISAMLQRELEPRNYAAATSFASAEGVLRRASSEALCDAEAKDHLRAIGESYDWSVE